MKKNLFCYRKVLPVCRDGKTALEIADCLGLKLGSIHSYLSKLQASGHIKKISRTPKALGALYVTISEEFKEPEKLAVPSFAMVTPEIAPGINQEFVKRSHNIWGARS
jgi:hypothetical protein